MKLYHRWKCPWCAAARQGAENVGVEVELVEVPYPREERDAVEAVSGQRRVPVLVNGDRVVVELAPDRPAPLRDLRRRRVRALRRGAGRRRDRAGVRRVRPRGAALVSGSGERFRRVGAGEVPYRERRGGGARLVRSGGGARRRAARAAHVAVRPRPRDGLPPPSDPGGGLRAALRRAAGGADRRRGREVADGDWLWLPKDTPRRIQNTTDREAVWLTIGAPPGEGITDGIRLDPATGEEIPRG